MAVTTARGPARFLKDGAALIVRNLRRRRSGPQLPLPPNLPKMVNTAQRPKIHRDGAKVYRTPNANTLDLGEQYELEVCYIGFDGGAIDDSIRKIAGLRNCDTGYAFAEQRRDLQFPCGGGAEGKRLAQEAAKRLRAVDYFARLQIRIRYPDVQRGKDTFSQYYCPNGHLIEEVKHRRHAESPFEIKRYKVKGRRRMRTVYKLKKKTA